MLSKSRARKLKAINEIQDGDKTEAEIQFECECMLDQCEILWFHPPNIKKQVKAKNFTGWPDLFIFPPDGVCFFVEVKTLTGKPDADQIELAFKLTKNHYKYFVVHSIKEFQLVLKSQYIL